MRRPSGQRDLVVSIPLHQHIPRPSTRAAFRIRNMARIVGIDILPIRGTEPYRILLRSSDADRREVGRLRSDYCPPARVMGAHPADDLGPALPDVVRLAA